MGCGDEKLSKYLTQTFIAHCNAMICQQVTWSGDAEWPKVADAVIEAHFATDPDMHAAAVVDVDEHGLGLNVALVDALRHISILDDEIGLGKAALQVALFKQGPA